ncbi:MAG: hypothetical protein RLZZ399_1076 [Verrucomicrobiota bacterium]|jgi:hypothetical protein
MACGKGSRKCVFIPTQTPPVSRQTPEHIGVPTFFPPSFQAADEGFEPTVDGSLEGFAGFLAGLGDFVPFLVDIAPTQGGRPCLADAGQPEKLQKIGALMLPRGPLAPSSGYTGALGGLRWAAGNGAEEGSEIIAQ